MSAQYVVVYTESVQYNPYHVTRAVSGPFADLDTAQETARLFTSAQVYRLDERLHDCPGCGHPECWSNQ